MHQRKEVIAHLGVLRKWNHQLRHMEAQNKPIYSAKKKKMSKRQGFETSTSSAAKEREK